MLFWGKSLEVGVASKGFVFIGLKAINFTCENAAILIAWGMAQHIRWAFHGGVIIGRNIGVSGFNLAENLVKYGLATLIACFCGICHREQLPYC